MRAVAHGNGHIRQQDVMHKAVDPIHLAEADQGPINGGIPFEFYGALDGTTTSVTVTLPAGFKVRVTDVWGVMTGAGGASDTYEVTDGTNSITGGTVDVSSAGDTDIVRATEIDDAFHEIDGGGTIVMQNASAATVIVYVHCIRVQ